MAFVTTRLGRWFYEEHGRAARDGEAIVLWHSLLCDGGMWDAQVPALTELGRVIVLDGAGHGKSEVPPPFSLDDNTRALVDALDSLHVDRVTMIGLSWGGMIGMRLALLAPERVAKLALLDTDAGAESKRNRIKYRALAAFFRRFGAPSALVEHQIAPLMFGMNPSAEHVHQFHVDLGGFPRLGVYRAVRAIMAREDIRGTISAIETPTLVVCGASDRATPVSCSRAIADAIPGARLEVIEGAGHLSTIEQPEKITRLLADFIQPQT